MSSAKSRQTTESLVEPVYIKKFNTRLDRSRIPFWSKINFKTQSAKLYMHSHRKRFGAKSILNQKNRFGLKSIAQGCPF
jgi:hypothetical protein